MSITSRQSIRPASDDSDAALVITTRAVVHETVVLATPQVVRLAYTVAHVEASLTLGGEAPTPWPGLGAMPGRGFEVMLTGRGAIVVPAHDAKLPDRLASWLVGLAEDVRCAWPALPDELRAGAAWPGPPIVPGGLPPGAVSADVTVACRAPAVTDDGADVQLDFALAAALERSAAAPTRALGRGTLHLHLERRGGPARARRSSVMSLLGPGACDQVVKADLELTRGR